jgi:hypothetical protein
LCREACKANGGEVGVGYGNGEEYVEYGEVCREDLGYCDAATYVGYGGHSVGRDGVVIYCGVARRTGVVTSACE